jgi:hypothetical protein
VTAIRRRTLAAKVVAMTMVLGCATGSEPIDPEAVQARIADSRAEFRALAESTIEDSGRAGQFVSLLDERDALITTHARAVQQYAETMKSLNTEYDATRDDFEKVILAYNSERRLAQSKFVDIMSRMKAVTTEKEWKRLVKFELKELHPQALVYSSEGP